MLGELTAAIAAADDTPIDAPLHFVTASNELAKMMTKSLHEWEDKGWIGIKDAPYIRTLAGKLRARCAITTFRKAEGPKDQDLIEEARKTIQRNDTEIPHRQITAIIPERYDLSGARLATLTQALAYEGIRESKNMKARKTTEENINRALRHINIGQAADIQEETRWKAARHKDYGLKIADFMWKALHGALKCGKYWENIPGYEERATCQKCGVEDSLRHILHECHAEGQRTVWNMTKKLWEKTNLEWKELTLEDTLTAGCKTWRKKNKREKDEGAQRLWRILISESAYLIWKLRCERVVGHSEETDWHHTRQAIEGKWHETINRRLRQDVVSTRESLGHLKINHEVVQNTWTKVLDARKKPPPDWAKKRVLVGIAPYHLENG